MRSLSIIFAVVFTIGLNISSLVLDVVPSDDPIFVEVVEHGDFLDDLPIASGEEFYDLS